MSVKTVNVDSIRVDRVPLLREVDEDKVKDLMGSIEALGVIHPLVISGPDSKKEYDLVIGRHRLEAARRLGKKVVPVLVRKWNNQDKMLAQLAENLDRADMTELEEARAFQRLIDDHGMTMQDISDRLGGRRTKQYVSQRCQLLKLHPDVVQALDLKLITFTDARELHKLNQKDQSEQVRSVLAEHGIVPEGTSEGEIADGAKKVKKEKKAKAPSKPSAKKSKEKKEPTKTQTQRRVSKAIRSKTGGSSRSGQKPGAAEKTKKEVYMEAKPKLIDAFKETRSDTTAAQEILIGEVMDFLFERMMLIPHI